MTSVKIPGHCFRRGKCSYHAKNSSSMSSKHRKLSCYPIFKEARRKAQANSPVAQFELVWQSVVLLVVFLAVASVIRALASCFSVVQSCCPPAKESPWEMKRFPFVSALFRLCVKVNKFFSSVIKILTISRNKMLPNSRILNIATKQNLRAIS